MAIIKIDIPLLNSLLTLATVIEARDAYTGGHTWRVGEYSRILAEMAGLERDEIFVAQLGGLVHDLGKVGISDAILNKQGKLTDEEYDLMKKHPELGKEIITSHPLAPIVLDAIANHHERFDGKGYPEARNGEDLSVVARIISIADAFDSMTSTRPYRSAMPAEKAYAILRSEAGTQFDGKLVDLFLHIAETTGFERVIMHYGEEKPMLVCPACGPVITASKYSSDGHRINCPVCKGDFRMHAAGQSFVLEWLETIDPSMVPKPDYEVIEDIIKKAPETVRVENWGIGAR